MEITTIKQLKALAQGQPVELPGFTGDAPFVCRLGRPSLMILAQQGNIPNPLLSAAGELFRDGLKTKAPLDELAQVMISVAKAAMLEPTYQDVLDAGCNLTDNQLVYIYMYVSSGVDTLRQFRQKQETFEHDLSGEQISNPTKPADEN